MRPAALLLVLALLAGPLRAAPDEVDVLVETIERHAKDPFEQRRREGAIRDLGRLGGARAAAAMLPLLEDPYEHVRDHAVSAWIDMLKGPRGEETRAWIVAKALASREEDVRAAAATALAIGAGAAAVPDLAHAIARERKEAALARMAEVVLPLAPDAGLGAALVDRLDARDGWALLALAEAAAHHAPEAAVPRLRALLDHRDPLARAGAVLGLQAADALPAERVEGVLVDAAVEPRIALAETLHLRTAALPWPGAGRAVLARLLEDPAWRVRAAAVQAALRVWETPVVELLVERLAPETGRVRDDVHRALRTLTRQTIAADPELWRSWWRTQGATFDPGRRPRLDDAGRVPFADPDVEPGAAGETRTRSFFDLPLAGERVAFVFDLSGSFRDAAFDRPDAPTKIDLLRAELARTLASLDEGVALDLLVYRYPSEHPPRPVLTRAFGRIQPASTAARSRAEAWLAKQEAAGWGAFVEPIEAAFADEFDTVVLLSDGRPSRGRLDRDFRVLREVPRANRFRLVAVDTVLVGDVGADRRFMERLASLTGGRFRSVVDPGR